jgi:hypothetical protein
MMEEEEKGKREKSPRGDMELFSLIQPSRGSTKFEVEKYIPN